MKIKIYSTTTERVYSGTDDTDTIDLYNWKTSKLVINEMLIEEFAEWLEGVSVGLGEEGGSINIFVITDENDNIISQDQAYDLSIDARKNIDSQVVITGM